MTARLDLPMPVGRPTTHSHRGASLPLEQIRHTLGTTSLGLVLVAQSAGGLGAVLLGDDASALRGDLAQRFPGADVVADDLGLAELLARVIAFIESPTLHPDLVLDMRGTTFQRTVWGALCEIPAGSTITYTELARRIGMPTSVRAVAAACAANALAVVVPCHRVIARDGSLTGYRWGVERKRALLDREAAEV